MKPKPAGPSRAWSVDGAIVALVMILAIGIVAGPAAADEGAEENERPALATPETTVPEEAVLGPWLTEGARAIVEITRCTDDNRHFCGTIVWTWKRARHVGHRVLAGFEYDGEQRWTGGRLFDPNGESSYRGRLEIEDFGRLKVRGCLLLFCQTETWLRPEMLREAMP